MIKRFNIVLLKRNWSKRYLSFLCLYFGKNKEGVALKEKFKTTTPIGFKSYPQGTISLSVEILSFWDTLYISFNWHILALSIAGIFFRFLTWDKDYYQDTKLQHGWALAINLSKTWKDWKKAYENHTHRLLLFDKELYSKENSYPNQQFLSSVNSKSKTLNGWQKDSRRMGSRKDSWRIANGWITEGQIILKERFFEGG